MSNMKNSGQNDLSNQMDSIEQDITEFLEAARAGRETFGEDDSDLAEYALEVVSEVGKPYAVVLCTGGPHIEVTADGAGEARLEGYWWGLRDTHYGAIYSEFLDWWIDRDSTPWSCPEIVEDWHGKARRDEI